MNDEFSPRFAYEDSEDEFEKEEELTKFDLPLFKWLKSDGSAVPEVDVLLIGSGGGATYLNLNIPKKLIGGFLMPEMNLKSNPFDQFSVESSSCGLYEIGTTPKTYMLLCCCSIDSEASLLLGRAILSTLRPKKVIMLDALDVSDYIPPRTNDAATTTSPIRYLQTSAAPWNCDFQMLEIPNIVKNLSGAILTNCEIKGIPAALYLTFEDRRFKLEKPTNSYKEILSYLATQSIVPQLPQCNKRSNPSTHRNTASNSTLYL
ncbi:hypothetical protein K493DRAFT_310234 [Basidiobolus meristosporus CBS 931.73]|uniref:Proteasome assembly chaperone 1 n=1 Tax=Basidiobolus meristosporus CBS 931.73 TaxID=1314790 RepID=A0A1Y1ZB04_9FUNG|nr:hypothetical protein K493DRAFT_310234 [Basidiobolus meristosporus CBS 931.73]|eukprot:ORY07503.1 hypothetical protein K493DRAFT_310234 [Basidiobolus meristosporus CBS 931.73]